MYWLQRPPYLRWIAAGLLVCSGLYLDMRPAPVVDYPFAATPIRAGDPFEIGLEWREVPAGLLPDWEGVANGIAATDIAPGTPIVPSLAGDLAIPPDWWTVSLPLPYQVPPGTRVRVAVADSVVEGVVAGPMSDTGFDLSGPVAFPSEQAAQVAAAAATNALVVMVGATRRTAESSG